MNCKNRLYLKIKMRISFCFLVVYEFFILRYKDCILLMCVEVKRIFRFAEIVE